MKKSKILIFSMVLFLLVTATGCGKKKEEVKQNEETNNETTTYKINLESLDESSITVYGKDDYESFLKAYQNNTLPNVYVTEFLFDGAGMVKPYDLDDFIDKGNDLEVDTLSIKTINIQKTGEYELTGKLVGGMVAINTNNLDGDIKLILNGVNIDTDSKKVPVIYVYNKDITYNRYKVTIAATAGTKNYLEGGKLKKTSLIGSDVLDTYKNNYTGDNLNNYNTYTNYYGIYTSDEVNKVLFAKVKADREDLADGDPYYYYKASGAISSDIDLYFEGSGYLEVTSKNKEGIESKGDLTFAGGIGDYVINSQDDSLNTTTDASENANAHNTLTIDVKSLKAIVSLDADEGDAIDSNGKLVINGGNIYAFAKPGQDGGLDAETGIYINGGTVLATGNMYEEITNNSKQNFMVLAFNTNITENTLITLVDEDDNALFAYKTDRSYTYLIYSSDTLKEGTYHLYKDGEVVGTEENGIYTLISQYTKGTELGYASNNMQGGMAPGDMPNDMGMGPGGMNNGSIPNGMAPQSPSNGGNALNKDFVISGISNIFSGVATYNEA